MPANTPDIRRINFAVGKLKIDLIIFLDTGPFSQKVCGQVTSLLLSAELLILWHFFHCYSFKLCDKHLICTHTQCCFSTRSAVSRTYAKHYKWFIKYWMFSVSNQKQSSERHTAFVFCVAILTWLESCCNEFAISAWHSRASSRFIAILNEKRLQRKNKQPQNKGLLH